MQKDIEDLKQKEMMIKKFMKPIVQIEDSIQEEQISEIREDN